jgi:predicted transposase/invertase (TIGR01784 family)
VIQKVICVCITSYELFGGVEEYVNCFRFYNRKNGLCFEEIPEEVYTVELAKVPGKDDGSAGWKWTQFLRSRRREEFEMVAGKDPEIRKAVESLYELSGDEKVRAEYEKRQKAWRDRMSQNEGYYLDGVQKGRQEGRQESMLEIARNLKSLGVSSDKIAQATGLNPADVAGL